MALKVIFEVHSTKVHERSGVSARTQKPYTLREQEAWVQIGDAPYPQRTKIMLHDGQIAYAVGKYELDDRSFSVGRFDAFQVDPVLVPLPQVAGQGAQAKAS